MVSGGFLSVLVQPFEAQKRSNKQNPSPSPSKTSWGSEKRSSWGSEKRSSLASDKRRSTDMGSPPRAQASPAAVNEIEPDPSRHTPPPADAMPLKSSLKRFSASTPCVTFIEPDTEKPSSQAPLKPCLKRQRSAANAQVGPRRSVRLEERPPIVHLISDIDIPELQQKTGWSRIQAILWPSDEEALQEADFVLSDLGLRINKDQKGM